jgi:DNA-binding XRE family transcriptional regulator
MTGKEFKIKRVTFDMKQSDIAKELGLNSNTISRYETGDLPVPKVVELSMETLEKRYIENQKQTTNTQ